VRQYFLLLAVLVVAPSDLVTSKPPPEPARPQTLAGALERADRRLEPATRQDEFDNTNIGARGRINATRDASREDQVAPGLADRPITSW
jgi:hypothetical protein